MRIKTKLDVVMLLSAAVVLFTAGLLYLEFEKGHREAEEAEVADDIAREMGELQDIAFGYVLHGRETAGKQLLTKYESIAPLLRRERFFYPEERKAMDKIREKYEVLGPVLRRLIAKGGWAESGREGRAGPREEETGSFDFFRVKSQEMHDAAESLGKTIRDEVGETHERVRWLIIVLSALVAVTLIVSSVLLGRMIVTPLARLQKGAEIIGGGNLLHKVGTDAKDEIGGLSRVIDRMTDNLGRITASRDELGREMEERRRVEGELRKSLAEVRTLKEILPICSSCRKIRDDKGYWEHLESYITTHTGTLLSHGMCQECMKKMYPEYATEEDKDKPS